MAKRPWPCCDGFRGAAPRTGARPAIRFVDVHGTDVPYSAANSPMDPSIPLPDALDELFDAAARISTIIRAPFARIDLYHVHGRVVFGEVTPRRMRS